MPRVATPSDAGAPRHNNVWLAMGVIVTRWIPSFRRRSSEPLGVVWKYVTTDAAHDGDERFALVECPDVFFSNATTYGAGGRSKISMGFQYSCFCKTVQWFRVALELVPTARFIGKMEDDSVLHDARVVAELITAHRLARRERKSPMLWYGHFAWALFYENAGGRAKFCGDADDHLLSTFPRVCSREAKNGVLAPFASGGLDIRSRALAERLATCELLTDFLRGYDLRNSSYGASCDGQQGYFVAKCLALPHAPDSDPASQASSPSSAAAATMTSTPPSAATSERRTRVATALHLPWPKFHPPSRRHGARLHSSLLHPHRPCVMHGRQLRQFKALQNLCEDPVPHTWRWNLGQAMLPLRFRLHGEWRRGLASLWWEAYNKSHVRAYHRLHAHKEDDRYCDHLPCGLAMISDRQQQQQGAHPTDDINLARPINVSVCGTMQECFAPADGGVYWYAGEGPRRYLVPWS